MQRKFYFFGGITMSKITLEIFSFLILIFDSNMNQLFMFLWHKMLTTNDSDDTKGRNSFCTSLPVKLTKFKKSNLPRFRNKEGAANYIYWKKLHVWNNNVFEKDSPRRLVFKMLYKIFKAVSLIFAGDNFITENHFRIRNKSSLLLYY